MRTINSTLTFAPIPVTVDLNVEPLKIEGKLIRNRAGEVIMNDQWLYGSDRYPINLNRSAYCAKVYLMNTKIADQAASEGRKPTDRLKRFIKQVSSTMVFEHNGIAYRVYLREDGKEMDLASVRPYWACVHSSGSWEYVTRKYGAHPGSRNVVNGRQTTYQLDIDLKEMFDFE